MSFVLGRALDALRIRGVRRSGIENAYSASQAAGVGPIACPLLAESGDCQVLVCVIGGS